jgi:curved DNA-binding protein CbpA
MAKSYFDILGVSPDATTEEIKNAYRRLAQQYHPDHEGGDSCTFRDVQEAYNELADPEQRQRHREHSSGERVPVRVVREGSRERGEPLRSGPGRAGFGPVGGAGAVGGGADHIAPSWRRRGYADTRSGMHPRTDYGSPFDDEFDELFHRLLRRFFS